MWNLKARKAIFFHKIKACHPWIRRYLMKCYAQESCERQMYIHVCGLDGAFMKTINYSCHPQLQMLLLVGRERRISRQYRGRAFALSCPTQSYKSIVLLFVHFIFKMATLLGTPAKANAIQHSSAINSD